MDASCIDSSHECSWRAWFLSNNFLKNRQLGSHHLWNLGLNGHSLAEQWLPFCIGSVITHMQLSNHLATVLLLVSSENSFSIGRTWRCLFMHRKLRIFLSYLVVISLVVRWTSLKWNESQNHWWNLSEKGTLEVPTIEVSTLSLNIWCI